MFFEGAFELAGITGEDGKLIDYADFSVGLLLTTHCSLLTAHYSLLTTHYSLLTSHYSLLTTHYSLLTAHFCRIEYYDVCVSPRLESALLAELRERVNGES